MVIPPDIIGQYYSKSRYYKVVKLILLNRAPSSTRGLCYRQPEPGTPPKVDP